MPKLLPETPQIRVLQTPGEVRSKSLDVLEHLVVILPAKPAKALWSSLPDGNRLQQLASREANSSSKILRSRLDNSVSTGVTCVRLPEKNPGDASVLLAFAGTAAADVMRDNPQQIGIMIAGLDDRQAADVAQALILAFSAHRHSVPSQRSKPADLPRLGTLHLLGLPKKLNLKRTLAEAHSLNMVRWLTALAPNRLDAARYISRVQQLARTKGWKTSFLNEARLKKLGAGAFLAVSQGNAKRDAGILHLRYRPGKATAKPDLALVGKGIIFDTGGTNIKPFLAMLDMHEDMAGSAVALATLLAIDELKLPFAVDCWLAITENRISETSYKSRDIVTACNGTTIEVIHTDAEGRMVLADTLALAARENPRGIIDYATLTGACVSALSERYSGVFSNRDALNQRSIAAGRSSGERVWPFPMDEDFDADLKSQAADILQCAVTLPGDHIHAARFLNRFVPENIPWLHVDLSSAGNKHGLAQVPAGLTGVGVRFTLSLLLDHGGLHD